MPGPDEAFVSKYFTPNPEQLAGPGMAANNAMIPQQTAAQAAIKQILLRRMMQQQGMQGMPAAVPPPMLGAPLPSGARR